MRFVSPGEQRLMEEIIVTDEIYIRARRSLDVCGHYVDMKKLKKALE